MSEGENESAPTGPGGPGARLRQAREAQGLTGQQAAEQLNLDLALIEALESDDFAALGAPVFAKGHLRKYSALLGLPEGEMLADYERVQVKPASPTLVPRARIEMQPERVVAARRWPWAVGGLLVFLLVAGIAAWLSDGAPGLDRVRSVFDRDGSQSATGESAPGTSPQATVVVSGEGGSLPAPGADGGSTAADGVPAEADAAAGSIAQTPVAPGQVALHMRFAADSWVEVYDASGKAVLYDLGRAESERVVAGQAPLNVTLGNAPAVTLRVDGRSVRVPKPVAGTIARFSVDADGSLR